jgi:thiamine-monophosphate kinase
MTEESIIKELTLQCRKAPLQHGIGDDCALISDQQVVSTDTMVEGIHFDERLSAEDIGWKLVAINASDIAAMGRPPSWTTLNVAIPSKTSMVWLKDFARGLRMALSTWNIELIGGDVVRTEGPIVLSMTMGGVGRSKPIWRSGAKIGNAVFVSGNLGEAAAGFFEKDNKEGLRWLQRPKPPIDFGINIGTLGIATAMMDLSDGLHKDLLKLCEASNVGAMIDPKKIHKGPALAHIKSPLPYQTSFGEDYELLFTANPEMENLLRQVARRYRVRITAIGKIISIPKEGPQAYLLDTPWPKPLFQHFS